MWGVSSKVPLSIAVVAAGVLAIWWWRDRPAPPSPPAIVELTPRVPAPEPRYCADVVDQHGRPVAHANVAVFAGNSPGQHAGCGARATANGRFCFPADDWQCTVGRLRVSLPKDRGGACAGERWLDDGARPARIAIQVDDRPTATLAGRVVDDRGQALAGARIDYQTRQADGRRCSFDGDAPAMTSHDGSFAVSAREGEADVSASAEGFATRTAVLRTGARDQRIVLDRGATWRGRTRAPDGRILTRARLTVVDLRGVLDVAVADGAFRVDRLAPGRHAVKLEVTDDPVLGTRTEWLTVPIAGREVADVRFSSGLDLEGSGAPAHGCVWAYPQERDHQDAIALDGVDVKIAATADGRFAFHDLKPGRWVVRICKDIRMLVVDAGRHDVVFSR